MSSEQRLFRSKKTGDYETFGPPYPRGGDWAPAGVSAPAVSSPPPVEVRRERLLEDQQRLSEIERAEAAQLHATRSKLDQIAARLDELPPAHATAAEALAFALEGMRLGKPATAFRGWSKTEIEAVRFVHSQMQAQRMADGVADLRGETRKPLPSGPQQGGRTVTVAEMQEVQRKLRGK